MAKKDKYSLAASVALLLGSASALGAITDTSSIDSAEFGDQEQNVISVAIDGVARIDPFILAEANPADISVAHRSHSSHSSHASHASHSSHSSHYSGL